VRPVKCNKCFHIFRGKGMSRVMRKILFHFCAKCWRDRNACEELMRKVAA
jgi:hypothetical protein